MRFQTVCVQTHTASPAHLQGSVSLKNMLIGELVTLNFRSVSECVNLCEHGVLEWSVIQGVSRIGSRSSMTLSRIKLFLKINE